MKLRIFILVVVCLGVGAAVWVRSFSRGAMPVYKGKTAEEWLAQVSTPDRGPAVEAFRMMGTNGFGVLLESLKKDEGWHRMNRWIFERSPVALQLHWPGPVPIVEGGDAFGAVTLVLSSHPDGRKILPDLVRMLDKHTAGTPVIVIALIGELAGPGDGECVPALMDGLKDKDVSLRYLVFNGLERIGPEAKPAVPVVMNMLHDSSVDVRVMASWTLWKINSETNTVVPILKEALTEPQNYFMKWRVPGFLNEIDPTDACVIPMLIEQAAGDNAILRRRAVLALSKFGSAASAAVPVLLQQVTNAPPSVRARALEALKRIDPEIAAKY